VIAYSTFSTWFSVTPSHCNIASLTLTSDTVGTPLVSVTGLDTVSIDNSDNSIKILPSTVAKNLTVYL